MSVLTRVMSVYIKCISFSMFSRAKLLLNSALKASYFSELPKSTVNKELTSANQIEFDKNMNKIKNSYLFSYLLSDKNPNYDENREIVQRFTEKMDQFQSTGIDMAQASTNEFIETQCKLLNYRILRLDYELKVFNTSPFSYLPSLRTCIAQLVLYYLIYTCTYRIIATDIVAPDMLKLN